jgi:hypothetical protein
MYRLVKTLSLNLCGLLFCFCHNAHSELVGEWNTIEFVKLTVTAAKQTSTTAFSDLGSLLFVDPNIKNQGTISYVNGLGAFDGTFKQKIQTKNRLDAPKYSFSGTINKDLLSSAVKDAFSFSDQEVTTSSYRVTSATFQGEEIEDVENEKILFGKILIKAKFTMTIAGISKKFPGTLILDVFFVGRRPQEGQLVNQLEPEVLNSRSMTNVLPKTNIDIHTPIRNIAHSVLYR